MVTHFNRDLAVTTDHLMNFSVFSTNMSGRLPSQNMVYAVRMHGIFPSMKVRAIPAQQKPYPTLAEAAKGQAIFEFRDAPGVMVGIWRPAYVGGVNAPGLHLHFLSTDKTSGGHVLDLAARRLLVTLDRTDGLDMRLPLAAPPKANENRVAPGDLDKIER
jgi:acetolactate decarboxylase